jgi:hypothetical protein
MDSWFCLSFFRRVDSAIRGFPKGAKNPAGKTPPPASDPSNAGEFGKISSTVKTIRRKAQIADSSSRKARQLLIEANNEAFSVGAMRVSDPNCSPLGING